MSEPETLRLVPPPSEEEQREQKRATRHARYIAHRDQFRAEQRVYYLKHRETILARLKHYGQTNAKVISERRHDRWKKRGLLKRYGMTADAFRLLLEVQNGRCAICREILLKGSGRGMHIDHDHETGRVRGLLCAPCNHGLGRFRDDPRRLIAAAKYLRKDRRS